MDPIVHLRVCSQYSLLYSSARIDQVIERAKEEGMSALGVSDRGGMYGALSCYRDILHAGLTPIMGQTIVVTTERSSRKSQERSEIVLIATSMEGYQSLTKLASVAALRDGDGTMFNTWTELTEYATGLLCLTGGAKGPLEFALRTKDIESGQRILQHLIRIYGEGHIYVELQSQGLMREEEEHRFFAELAKSMQVPIVATSEVRYLDKADLQVVDILAGIREGVDIEAASAYREQGATSYFRSTKEMQSLFANYPEALRATAEIARKAKFSLPLEQWSMPYFPLPQGRSEADELVYQAQRGLIWRKVADDERYQQRLKRELDVIISMGFSGYFLIVWDFMHYAHEQGISTGPGRGSAAGSLVSYALAITDVDPIAENLLFERFLNPERVSWPDIDIDFEAERRYEVIAYVSQKYGRDHVGHIGTLGTFAARAAVRDVGRVLQAPQVDIDRLARAIPTAPGITLQGAIDTQEEMQKVLVQTPSLQRLVNLALRIEGLPRHASLHAAGIVISRDPLSDLVPLMRGGEYVVATQYGMDDIAAIGLLKMDFLGLRTLTICDRAKAYILRTRGVDVQFSGLPMDEQTLELLAQGDTDGCFQLESTGVKRVLRDLRPTTLEDLIAVISLYRPGPMEQIGTFIQARRGDIPVLYEVPELESILQPTYGIIVYQEQIMQIAAAMAGFSLGEADVLRRAVSKKQRDVLDAERAAFVAGCIARGHTKKIGDDVYDLIVRFADYGFNRSHAAAYAVLAHRTAYLKANFRAEFMAALMTDVVSRPEKLEQYATACTRVGIRVLGPDVNRSEDACVPEILADGEIAIRLGLSAVKHVGVSAILQLVKVREQEGAFQSWQDIITRIDSRALTRRVLESLVQSGACDSFGISRRQLLLEIERAMSAGRSTVHVGQMTLHGLVEDAQENVRAKGVGNLPDDPKQCAQWERELIGFSVSFDPYEAITAAQQRLHVQTLQEVSEHFDAKNIPVNEVVHVLGKVATIRSVSTKKGEMMAFITLEDRTARMEVVVFPLLFRQWATKIQVDEMMSVTVKRDASKGKGWIAVKLHEMTQAHQPMPIDEKQAVHHAPQRVYIRVDKKLEQDAKSLLTLRALLVAHSGPLSVILVYESGKQRLLDVVRVALSDELIVALQQIVGEGNVRIR